MPVPTPIEDLDEFGAMVRAGRKAKNLSQDELAEVLGVVQSQVSAIERGTSIEISATLLVRLERALGLDAGVLARAAARRDPRLDAVA